MGNGYPTLPCAKPARGAGPGCYFGNLTQPAGGFLFCNRKKLPKMAVSSHFRPFCDRVLPGRVFGWQPDPPAGCQVGGLPEPKPGPTRPIAQPNCEYTSRIARMVTRLITNMTLETLLNGLFVDYQLSNTFSSFSAR